MLAPLHRRWQFVVQTDQIDCRHEFTGPVRAEQAIHVRLATNLVRCIVHGRVQLASGLPVPGAYVWLAGEGFADSACEPSDATGQFRLSLVLSRSLLPASGRSLRCTRTATSGELHLRDVRIQAGVNDVGTLVAPARSSLPLLATVRLTRDGVAIVDGVDLRVMDLSTSPGIWSTTTTRVGDAFELREELATVSRTRLFLDGWVAGRAIVDNLPFDCGSTLDITVPPPPTTLAVAILRPPVPWQTLWASLESAATKATTVAHPSERAGALAFRWQTAPGTYTLRIGCQHTVVYESTGVDLREGGNAWPAGGAVLDLRARARAIPVSVASATGEPLREVCSGGKLTPLVFAVPRDADVAAMLRFGACAVYRGRSAIVRTDPPSDLIVAAAGHAPVRIAAPSAAVTVTLPANPQIVLHPPAGDEVELRVRLVDDGLRDPLVRAADADTAGTASLQLGGERVWQATEKGPACASTCTPTPCSRSPSSAAEPKARRSA